MQAFLIGPSNVGKSTYAKYAEGFFSNCRHYNLDALVSKRQQTASVGEVSESIGNDGFLRLCQEETEQYTLECESENHLCLFDVGAGAMQSHKVGGWMESLYKVAITCSREKLYLRWPSRGEAHPLSEYERIEFTQRQGKIYDSANIKLDVTELDEDASKEEFVKLLKQSFPFLVRRTNS